MADGQIIIDINADPSEYRRALDRLRSATRSAAGSMSDSLKSAGASISGIGDALTVGITTPLSVGAAAAGKFSYEALKSAEQVDIAFGTMLGPQKGKEMLEDLYDFAASTPFEVRGLSSATQKMLAYGFSAEDVIPLLTSVGDATAGLGAGQEGIDAVTRAMGQMQAKGKVMSEEMLQLTEAGIPAWQYLADEITDGDIPAAMEEVTYGFVSADTAIAALQKGMDRDFGGMMSKQAKTLTGIVSNMSDAVYKAVIQAKDTEGYDELTDALAEVSEQIGPFVESLLPILEDLLEGAAGMARGAAGAMEEFSQMSEEGRRGVVNLVAGAAALGPTMSVAGRVLQAAGTAAGSFGGGVDKAKSAASKAKSGVSSLAKNVDKAALAFQVSRAYGDSFAASLGAAGSQMAGAAKQSTLLQKGLGLLKTGLAGLGVGAAVAGVALFASSMLDAKKRSDDLSKATDGLADAVSGASAAASAAGGGVAEYGAAAGSSAKSVDELIRSQAAWVDELNAREGDLQGSLATMDAYGETIEDLAGRSDLTAGEQAKLQAAVDGFNDACGTSLEVAQDAGGAYQVMSDGAALANDEIARLIQTQKAQAQVEVYQQGYADALEQEADAAATLAEATQRQAEAQERYNEAAAAGWSTDALQQYAYELDNANARLEEAQRLHDGAAEALSGFEGKMTLAQMAAENLDGGFAALIADNSLLQSTLLQNGFSLEQFRASMEQTGISVESFQQLNAEQMAQLAQNYDGTITSITGQMQQFGADAGFLGTDAGQRFSSGLSGTSWQALEAAAQVCGTSAAELAKLASDAGMSGDEAVQAYAEGILAGKDPTSYSSEVVSSAAAGQLESLRSRTLQWGADAGNNFASGILAAKMAAIDAASQIASSIADILGHSVAKRGPLHVGGKGEALWGEHAAVNFASGFAAASPAITRAVGGALGGMARMMDSAAASGWSVPSGWAGSASYHARGGGYAEMARSLDALGRRVDAMADRLERAICRPSELTVNRREFGRMVKGAM